MDPLKSLVRWTPDPVTTIAKSLGLDSLYYRAESSQYYDEILYVLNRHKVVFNTPAGSVSLVIPDKDSPRLLVKKIDTFGGYEPGLVYSLSAVLDSSDILYDIGAGYGYNGAVARKAGVSGKNIHCFEIDESRATYCAKNHPEASLRQEFVGDGSGESVTIDSYTRSNASPTVIAMDIEGAEGDAVRGIEETLSRCRPVVFVEIHPEYLPEFNSSPKDVYDTFAENNYEMVVGNHRCFPVEWTSDLYNPPISHQAITPTYTLFARPSENLSELNERR